MDEKNVIVLNNKEVKLDDLEGQLKLEVERMNDNGIKNDQIITPLKVKPNAKMGTLSDIAIVLKKLDLRRLEYSEWKD